MRKSAVVAVLALTLSAAVPEQLLAESKGIVVVAGATGRTGRLLVKHLAAQGYTVRAMVRSLEKGTRVLGDDVAMVKADVTVPSTLAPLLAGADFVISAIGSGGKATPEAIDYGGSVALIDAAVAAGIKKFIMVTSGGVTWRFHPLNLFGRDVLKWKHKAELYLRASGLVHVIVRPNGGLTDDPGNTNKITFTQNDRFGMTIAREDVAIVCTQALAHGEADNKTFEIQNDGDGLPTGSVDWAKTFGNLSVQSDNF